MAKAINCISELRQDPTSGDWVVVAQNRANRPDHFQGKKATECPFCFGKNIIIPNKYPAFCGKPKGLGKQTSAKEANFFIKEPAIGVHEVVVFKNHNLTIADLPVSQIQEIIDIYQQRYSQLAKEKTINYVFIFHNHGKMAGASIPHPHSQIIATPIVDFNFLTPLKKARDFYQKNKKCVYCSIIKAEQKAKQRIIFENDNFISFCPFASKISYEINIFPEKHKNSFEQIAEQEKSDLAQILKNVLAKLKKALNNPDYNFYIKTSPCDENQHPYFHWHLTILPKTQIYAGFELGSGIEIVSTAPEQAADILRKTKI